jgi:hypothetical protein
VKAKKLTMAAIPSTEKKKKCSISGYTTHLIIIPYILGLGAKTQKKRSFEEKHE